MRHVIPFARMVLIAAAWLLAADVVADPPDILRNYRFIPSRSTVHVTGGFAGFDWLLTVDGQFGLVTGYRYGSDGSVPTIAPYAQFVDVDAILFEPRAMAPMPVPGWDLDATLNLTGLEGTFRDRGVLQFVGNEGQGWPIKLQATLDGRLLHLTGENDPGCCDFFHYSVDAWAHLAPYSDFNLDGAVDQLDLDRFRNNYGLTGASFEQGDGNGDGAVDARDFMLWQSEVGMAMGTNDYPGLSGALAAVPEPGTVLLLLLGAIVVGWHRPPSSYVTPATA